MTQNIRTRFIFAVRKHAQFCGVLTRPHPERPKCNSGVGPVRGRGMRIAAAYPLGRNKFGSSSS
ncbi:hypothetical protein CDAR_582161, partial [Caerostris darwini]